MRFESSVSSKTIGFTYAPSINACSRLLGNIEIPVKPFLLEDCFHTYVRYGVHFDMVFWGIY